ncbi:MAG: hypothetical protein QOF47_3339, partial [Mycobacterium sp.]|nr:hypothetical protein [Mycobacterium sp.]
MRLKVLAPQGLGLENMGTPTSVEAVHYVA